MKFNVVSHSFEEVGFDENKLAVAASDTNCSWSELKQLVDCKRALLESLNIPKGHPVVVYGHKQIDFIVSIMACIQLELPYIPVDVLNPLDRIKKIKEVTGSNVLVNCLDEQLSVSFNIEIKGNEIVHNASNIDYTGCVYLNELDPIIYIIFTSGSTGEPKGVQITRSAVKSFLEWMTTDFDLTSKDVFINQAPFSFDLSVYELLTFMQIGGGIILNTKENSQDPEVFLKRIQRFEGTIWVSTPSFAYIYLKVEEFRQEDLPSLKQFLFCGEALPIRTANLLNDLFPKSKVLNTYGPTEATVATTKVEVTPALLEKYQEMPVGYVKKNTEIRIENEKGNQGEVGEIVIVGDNVTIGYFNNEELNVQKCGLIEGTRFFKTGDYGYFKDDLLFFSGRRDEQVKLNGYRIEIGDISAQLESIENITKAVTIPLKIRGEVKKLISFYTVKAGELIEYQALIESLADKLPHYMLPAKVIELKEFPINTNHKIDKKLLQEQFLKGVFR